MKKLINLFILILLLNLSLPFSNAIAYELYTINNEGLDNENLNNKYIIFIDVNQLTLCLLDSKTKEVKKSYPIAIGKKDTPSPIGNWQISSKALMNGPFGGYWLGLNAPWDTFGIHGTSRPDSIGSMASSGCIRMFNHNAKELFYLVDYDTQVIIYSGPSWLFSNYARDIKPGDRGSDVYEVQRRLQALGYFKEIPTGIYDYSLEVAVEKYSKNNSLPPTLIIDKNFLNSIGIFKFE